MQTSPVGAPNQTHMKLKSIKDLERGGLHTYWLESIRKDRHHLLQTIRKEVEGKKQDRPKVPETEQEEQWMSEHIGYNQALQDILTLLTTLEKEV